MLFFAYGMPGSGKSTLLHDMVRAMALTHLCLVNDHEAQWGHDGLHWRGRPPALKVIYKGSESHRKFLEDVENNEVPPVGVFVFRGFDGRELAELAQMIGWCVLVDDESDKLCRKDGFDKSPVRSIVNEGRHLRNAHGEHTEVSLIGACRRPQKLHNDASELADHIAVFRCQGVRTLGRLLEDNHIEDSDVERIKSLPNFHYRLWPENTWHVLEAVKPRPLSASERTVDGEVVRNRFDPTRLLLSHDFALPFFDQDADDAEEEAAQSS